MAKTEGRSTVYNLITDEQTLRHIHNENKRLEKDFLDYLKSTNKSKETIKQYTANLHIFWCWNYHENENKRFTRLTKRELIRFQRHAIEVWGWSPKRIRTVKATLSSLSKYIENILDDEYQGYQSIIGKVASPPDIAVREKTVFTEEELTSYVQQLAESGKYIQACALSLVINSGRRKEELQRLKVGYFRPEFTICDGALYKTPEKIRTKGPGEEGKPLHIYVLRQPFDPYLQMWLDERERLGIRSQWLFPRWNRNKGIWEDKPIRISLLNSWARTFSADLGKPFYWHSTRHFFTTRLASYGIPTTAIQDLIGWSNADMVSLYDDTDKDVQFERYFDRDGIKRVKPHSLEEL